MAQPSTEPDVGAVTADEARNGWTAESLAQYLEQRQREKSSFAKQLEQRGVRDAIIHNTRNFDPHSW